MSTPSALQRWAPVYEALAELRRYLSDQVPELQVEHINDRQWSRQRYLDMRAAGAYYRNGIYLHFSTDEALLYVGMATAGFDRFWNSRPDDARFTDVIPVPADVAFLIPAIERFLITRLSPRDNAR